MSDRHGPGTPPPFPGRDHYRSRSGRGGGQDRTWEQEYFGKRPEQSWADYFGLGPDTFCRSQRQRRDDRGPAPSGDAIRPERHDGHYTGDSMNEHYASRPYRLWRSRSDRKIGGVCGGIAEYANVDAWIIRVGFIIGFFFFPPVFMFGYPILWWLLKSRPAGLYETREEEVFWHSVATKPGQTLSGQIGRAHV